MCALLSPPNPRAGAATSVASRFMGSTWTRCTKKRPFTRELVLARVMREEEHPRLPAVLAMMPTGDEIVVSGDCGCGCGCWDGHSVRGGGGSGC